MANDPTPTAALLDIDGTLLDSNDAHAWSWVQVLERHGRPVLFARVRPLIGKGGDKLLAELLGIGADEPLGRRLSEDRRRLFLERHLPRLRPTRGARELLQRMQRDGLALVVATSASGDELQALLRQAGVDDLIARSATASDAGHSKPDPDIVLAALRKSGVAAERALMVGDTPYDIAAARAVGVATIAKAAAAGTTRLWAAPW
jgi:HAD superfamily hydrolase (TIGR01509 family)